MNWSQLLMGATGGLALYLTQLLVAWLRRSFARRNLLKLLKSEVVESLTIICNHQRKQVSTDVFDAYMPMLQDYLLPLELHLLKAAYREIEGWNDYISDYIYGYDLEMIVHERDYYWLLVELKESLDKLWPTIGATIELPPPPPRKEMPLQGSQAEPPSA